MCTRGCAGLTVADERLTCGSSSIREPSTRCFPKRPGARCGSSRNARWSAFTGAAFFRIAIHPSNPNTVWAATSAGLFRSTDGGGTWTQMMWERKLDVATAADVDLYVRDHLMATGRGPTPEPVAAAFEDPLHFLDFWALRKGRKQTIEVRRFNLQSTVSFLAAKGGRRLAGTGIKSAKPTRAQLAALRCELGKHIEAFDLNKLYGLDKRAQVAELTDVGVPAKRTRIALILSAKSAASLPAKFQVVQRDGKAIVGGSDFVLRVRKRR